MCLHLFVIAGTPYCKVVLSVGGYASRMIFDPGIDKSHGVEPGGLLQNGTDTVVLRQEEQEKLG